MTLQERIDLLVVLGNYLQENDDNYTQQKQPQKPISDIWFTHVK